MTGRRRWDAVVVGAGPAGALVALELARAGCEVLLVERHPFPRWKVCGACLSPGTRASLRDAGLAPVVDGLGPTPLRTLRLGGWGARADVPLGASGALSRAAFDAALVGAAVDAGAVFLSPARARLGPLREGGFRSVALLSPEGAVEVSARLVVAADGLGSAVMADALGPERRAVVGPASRIGFGALLPACVPGYPAGVIHMAVGAEGYVGIVRLEDGSLDVGAALDPDALGTGTPPERLVASLLEGAGFDPLPSEPPVVGWRGTPRLTWRPAARGAERVLAVGDAAGYVEPFTGEGIGWAVAGARALAPVALAAVERWTPARVPEWDAAWRATVGRSARLCRGIAGALRSPALARAGLGVLGAFPRVAGPLVRRAARAPRIRSGRSR